MTNLDSILKSRDITLSTKVHLVKVMVFPVVMCGGESWPVKKAEHQITDAFELWCWRRLLRVPWTVRRSNQSILKEISPGCSLEGLKLMLKLKLQYYGHLMWRVDSLEELTLMLGGIGGRRRRGQQRMRWLDGITDLMHEFEWTPGVGYGQVGLAWCNSWGRKELDMTEQLNWTQLNLLQYSGLENSMDSIIHGITKGRTWLNDFHFHYWWNWGCFQTSLLAQTVKRLSIMWETWVWSLGWEDSLEKEMATHSSTLALKIPWDRGAWWRLLSMGWQRVARLSNFTFTFHCFTISNCASVNILIHKALQRRADLLDECL